MDCILDSTILRVKQYINALMILILKMVLKKHLISLSVEAICFVLSLCKAGIPSNSNT